MGSRALYRSSPDGRGGEKLGESTMTILGWGVMAVGRVTKKIREEKKRD